MKPYFKEQQHQICKKHYYPDEMRIVDFANHGFFYRLDYCRLCNKYLVEEIKSETTSLKEGANIKRFDQLAEERISKFTK